MLNIYYQNTRGLRTKTHEVYRNICIYNYDIIIFTETWLNDTVLSGELFGNDYNVYRKDRFISGATAKKDGGGVLVAVNKNIISTRLVEWDSDGEDLWISINICLGNTISKLVLCAAYLPPPVNKNCLAKFINNCNRVSELHEYPTLIVGDFNLNSFWCFNSNQFNVTSVSPLDSMLRDFCNVNNLMQYNNVPNVHNRLLDLVLADFNTCNVTECFNCLTKIDPLHPPLLITANFHSSSNLMPNSNRKIYNYHKGNYVELRDYLANINWQEKFEDCGDVTDMVDIFNEILERSIQLFIPLLKRRSKQRHPWISQTFLKRLKEKYKIKHRYNKYKNPMDRIELQLLNSRCNRLARIDYMNYITGVEKNIKTNCKAFWGYIKNKRKNVLTYPAVMHDEAQTADNGADICDLFAKYFHSVYETETSISFTQQVPTNACDNLGSLFIERKRIREALKSLDRSKGAGPDGIPPIFLVECADLLSLPLWLIFNESLTSGEFPIQWKSAKTANSKSTSYTPILKRRLTWFLIIF
ncbi:unnamed protein product [Colias eurytheme]|nr:unnamed protein product [Colias eurytheme]